MYKFTVAISTRMLYDKVVRKAFRHGYIWGGTRERRLHPEYWSKVTKTYICFETFETIGNVNRLWRGFSFDAVYGALIPAEVYLLPLSMPKLRLLIKLFK